MYTRYLSCSHVQLCAFRVAAPTAASLYRHSCAGPTLPAAAPLKDTSATTDARKVSAPQVPSAYLYIIYTRRSTGRQHTRFSIRTGSITRVRNELRADFALRESPDPARISATPTCSRRADDDDDDEDESLGRGVTRLAANRVKGVRDRYFVLYRNTCILHGCERLHIIMIYRRPRACGPRARRIRESARAKDESDKDCSARVRSLSHHPRPPVESTA